MVTYRRVATGEQNDDGGSSAAGSRAQGMPSDDESSANQLPVNTRSRSERISDKLHAMVWIVVSYGIASYTHLFHTIFTDERIIRPIFHLSIILFTINAVLTLYLTVYLPSKFPVTAKYKTPAASPAFWDVYCPRVIPTMTACGVIGSFLLVRACYPVWGFLTPLILGAVALGVFFSLHFIPWF